MNELHWLASHWVKILSVWMGFSVLFVCLYAIALNLWGESDQERDARRKRESADRAARRLRETIRDFQATERERVLRDYDARANRIVQQVLDEDAIAFRLDTPTSNEAA